jgi:hypothetical protein
VRKSRQGRWELTRIAKALKRLRRRAIPQWSGEAKLRERIRQRVPRPRRAGVDDTTAAHAIREMIDSHSAGVRAALSHQQRADDAEFGDLEARLDGVIARCREDEAHHSAVVDDLRYQRRSAQRRIEDRDTPMPAGPYGVETDGFQHGNVGDLIGRGLRTRIILWIVLLLVMAADIIVFRQVVARVLNVSERDAMQLAVALTGATTYIAHLVGELFKKAVDARQRIRKALGAWMLATVWTGMGIGVFVFRLLAGPSASSTPGADFAAGPAAGATSDDSSLMSALLLMFLYALTGAVAASAGYQRPRVEIEQYRRTKRALRRAEPRLAAYRQDSAEAAARRTQLKSLRFQRERQYQAEAARCEELARQLKAEVFIPGQAAGDPDPASGSGAASSPTPPGSRVR